MPLVQLYKAARRSRRLKGRPEWQDVLPPEKELRDAYAIAARHVNRFSRAFLDVSRGLLTDEVARRLRAILRDGTAEEAVAAIPWFNPGDTDAMKVWTSLGNKLRDSYADVVQESGRAEFRRLKLPLRFQIEKQEVPTVPINPYSLAWITEHSGDLIREISDSQKQTIRDIIYDGFSQGKRAEAIIAEIQDTVGLLPQERAAVLRRQALHEDAGLSQRRIEELTDKYREQLLKKRAQRIARTETIAAQAQGRNDAWRLARESGALPRDVVRTWVAAPESPNPGRPCAICLDLDTKTAPIGQPYDSLFLGTVPRPPAHPHCRCTETIGRPK